MFSPFVYLVCFSVICGVFQDAPEDRSSLEFGRTGGAGLRAARRGRHGSAENLPNQAVAEEELPPDDLLGPGAVARSASRDQPSFYPQFHTSAIGGKRLVE